MQVWLGGVVLAALGGGAANADQAAFTAHRDHVLGTSFDLAMNGGEEDGVVATATALAEIARLDAMLSGWRGDSELAALNRATEFEASPDLFALIAYGEALRAQSGDAFSPRLGLLTRSGAAPLNERARLAATIAAAPVRLDPSRRLIVRPDEVIFDLDAFAKGYIIDRALRAARAAAPHAQGMLLNIGGDMAAFGVADDGNVWRVGVAAPGDADNAPSASFVRLDNAALAMSGGGARDVLDENNALVSHLVNGGEGVFAPRLSSAAVVAPQAIQADALATLYALSTPDRALAHADATGVGARLSGGVRNSYWPAQTFDCQAVAPLPTGYSVDVSFDIPQIDVGNYERPYVSIWISGADRQLVRTLLVLGDKARWREENYVWWRRYERMDVASIQAIARPSRAPGRYTVSWDGRDQSGAAMPQGTYTLNIEVAREHGSHTIKTIELNLGAGPVDAAIPATDELGAVAAHYGSGR